MDENYKISSKKTQVVTFLCVFILFGTTWAFLQGGGLGGESIKYCSYFLMCVAVGVILIFDGIKQVSYFEFIAIISIFINKIYTNFYTYTEFSFFAFVAALPTLLFCIIFCFQSDKIRESVFIYFKKIMVVLTLVGFVCYSSYMLGIGIPYDVIYRDDTTSFISYKICYLSNISIFDIVRFNGFFDEPGYYGTFAAFLLCADKLNLKKIDNIILLVGGLLSLSLAFVLLLIIYYFIANIKQLKKWIWLVVIGISFFMIQDLQTGNQYVDALVTRMAINDEGFAGDNRYGHSFEKVWEDTLREDMFYVGYGKGYAEYFGTGEGEGLASIKSYIVNYGIIGTLIMFAPMFVLASRQAFLCKNQNMFLYILITYISLYQRPYLFAPAYFIIFICGISYIALNEKR